jgi:3-hydroxyisobutyrate dehydrogenase
MCQHVLQAGYLVAVHNRTRHKADPLLQAGARWCETPRQVAESSDIVFTIVGYPHDVERVVLDHDIGVLSGCSPDSILVDMTTSSPALAQRIAAVGAAQRVSCLDAPVSGGDVGAREARLSIMVGGDEPAFQQILPILNRFGKTIVYQGQSGSGQHTKMVNQILIASGMIGVCEALLYAYRAKLDLHKVLQSVAMGAAGSWSLSNYGPRILRGDFQPGFLVEHFIKDMGLALEEAARMKLSLPGLALARQLYIAVAAEGNEQAGTHALQLALARLSGIDWNARGHQQE